MQARLYTHNLSIEINGRVLVHNLNIDIAAGTLVCVLGTNGIGKTLTLHTLAGLRPTGPGRLDVCGDKLHDLPRKEIARRLGLLLQLHEDAFPLSVMDSVLMGLYPRLGMWQWTQEKDHDAAQAAINCFDLEGLENRLITTLSGGERERVALATLMVQNPLIWMLDEPMNHLDPRHQLSVFATLKAVAEQNRIVITTVHNPALAMRYADQALLLYGDGDWEFGAASELLEPARLERMYQTPFEYYSTQGDSACHTLLMPA